MNLIYLAKLNEIISTLSYNSERGYYLEQVLIHFLKNPKVDFDIKSEMKKIVNKELEEIHKQTRQPQVNQEADFPLGSVDDYFKRQETVLNYNIRPDFAEEYVQQYLKYDEGKKAKDDLKISLIIRLFQEIAEISIKKSEDLNFYDEVYAFKSGEELCDFSFMQIPSQRYIDNFSKCMVFNCQECMDRIPDVSAEDLQNALRQISISNSTDLNELNLLEKPVLQISDQTFQILRPSYLLRGLPQRCRILLMNCERFIRTKGKTFEKVALGLLETIPRSKLYKNIMYSNGRYELDGILNFKESTWLIECSSHPPSLSALRGNMKAISNDLDKSLWKCEKQATRAFENIRDPSIQR
jgi:hypothetical protein